MTSLHHGWVQHGMANERSFSSMLRTLCLGRILATCGVSHACSSRAPSGRQRFNVLGALNAVSHQLVTVTNDTYINAERVCELLKKLKKLELTTPITVVLDNSRYQRCGKVMECAANLGIKLLFLPPYSPNLNIIERLWKFVKKECLY